MNIQRHDFAAVLHANGPDPERADVLQLYGRFVGDWNTEIIAHGPDGAVYRAQGEIHFGWILEGRAIQDVWMIPRLVDRASASPLPVAGNWYGTTIRIYDPTIHAWRIYWIDPARGLGGVYATQILPFADPKALSLFHEFERAVYQG